MYGIIQTWGMYGAYRHMGVYRCMGDVQKYGEHTDVWGMYRCNGGVQMLQSYRHPQT